MLEYQLFNKYINLNKHDRNDHVTLVININRSNMTKIYLFLELHEYLKEIWGEDSMKVVQQASHIAKKGWRKL